jgi:mannan endo-1,4-beta-mannosidase
MRAPAPPAAVALAAVASLVGAALAQPAPAIPSPPAVAPPVDRSRFVQVDGRRFVVDGRPFRFVGANASVMHGLPHRAAVDAIFDAAAADGLKVVRVWALGEQPDDAQPWARDFAFRIGRDGWVEESFAHLDRVLDAARARGLRVIVVLANRWGDYGGLPRYLDWAGVTLPMTPGVLPDFRLRSFFGDAAANALYRAHVARVVGRVNARTGLAYRDDPTVFAWELINESDAARHGRDELVGWTRTMARYVRSLDPVHMIAAGHIGYTNREQRGTWLALQRLPEVSYADAHAYPTAVRGVRTLAALDDFVDDHAQLARYAVAKPFVWGEFGFTTLRRVHFGLPRARWTERFLERSEMDGVDGALAWIYTVTPDRPHEHGLLVDGPAAETTRDLRAVLARYAARWSAGAGTALNPRLSEARGEAPIWSTRRFVAGRAVAAPTVRAGAARWSMAPGAYARIEAENIGRWDGFAVTHFYGSGAATFAYRFRVTEAARAAAAGATGVRVRLRASSELPGRGEGSTAEDESTLRIAIDDAAMGEVAVPLDDGAGRWIELRSDAPAVLAALRAGGVHTLRLEVPDGPRANGLAVYGAATGREPVPEGTGPLPGRVVIELVR